MLSDFLRDSSEKDEFDEFLESEKTGDNWPDVDTGNSTSYGFYLTPEKALTDIKDRYFHRLSDYDTVDYDSFIDNKISEQIESFKWRKNQSKSPDVFAMKAMDDEASHLVSRYVQFGGGIVLGIGGTGISIATQGLSLGSTVGALSSFAAGGLIMDSAFNGTAETVDLIMSYRDNLDVQEQIWEEALELHRDRNDWETNQINHVERNHEHNHPASGSHSIGYKSETKIPDFEEKFDLEFKSEDGYRLVNLANDYDELERKRGRKNVIDFQIKNARVSGPLYGRQMLKNGLNNIKTPVTDFKDDN